MSGENRKNIEASADGDTLEACPHCGQLYVRGGHCDCFAAVADMQRGEKIKQAMMTLVSMCNGLSREVLALLQEGCKIIGNEHANKIKIDIDGVSVTVSGCKDSIRCDRVDKRKVSETV